MKISRCGGRDLSGVVYIGNVGIKLLLDVLRLGRSLLPLDNGSQKIP